MITALFKREFLAYFRSPVAYVFLVVFLVFTEVCGFFLGRFFEGGSATLEPFFRFYPFLFLFLGPALGMRLWAEERRSGSFELLFTLPVTPLQAVLGKFLAGWAFFAVALLLTLPNAVMVAYLGDPDWGVVVGSYLGALLMAGAYVAISSLMSSLTKNQIVAFVLSFVVCGLLVLVGASVFTDFLTAYLPVTAVDAVANFGFFPHYESITRGLLGLSNLAYFVSLGAFALFLNVVAVER